MSTMKEGSVAMVSCMARDFGGLAENTFSLLTKLHRTMDNSLSASWRLHDALQFTKG